MAEVKAEVRVARMMERHQMTCSFLEDEGEVMELALYQFDPAHLQWETNPGVGRQRPKVVFAPAP